MRTGAICWIVACLVASAAGCGDTSTGGNNGDASVLDGALADSSQPDGALPDAQQPDAVVPDAQVPDAQVPDAQVPDAVVPDAQVPDAQVPDAQVPDAETPDAVVPDAQVPDAQVPDAQVPDAGPQCGDGVLNTGELCDTGIASGPGSCPTSCTTTNPCQPISLQGGGTCEAECVMTTITQCTPGDSCCPTECNATSDTDCSSVCGNGVLEPGELCDTGIPSGAGSCPTNCDDSNGCTVDTVVGTGCQAECDHTTITPLPSGTGFAPTELQWNLPDISVWGNSLYWVQKENESGYWNWATIDMNGDSMPDLVWTEDPDQYYDAWMNGTQPYWKVYLGTGAGFAPTELQWNLPDISSWGNSLYWVQKENESGYWNWATIDMNGDSMPDLVWTEDPDQYYDAWMNGAQPYWKVFLNTGTGFAPTEIQWNLPDISAWGNSFYWVQKENESGYWNWATIDMNGDSMPDLVWTEDPDQYYDAWMNGAQPYWKVFLNTGTGFAPTEIQWNLPDISAWGNNFYWVQKENESGYWNWATIDMNGDSMPDLVWTEDPDQYYDAWMNGTQPYWKVFLNTGTGFAPTEIQWNLPDISAWGNNFYWVQKENESGYWNWRVLDMDGDARPDLVWTEDPDQYYDAWNQACEPYWKVFLNSGTGFAAAETVWRLPDISLWGNNFYWVHKENESGYWNWTARDMDGDGQPDLVWTEDPDQYYDAWMNGAQPFWKVFPAQ